MNIGFLHFLAEILKDPKWSDLRKIQSLKASPIVNF